MRKTRIICTLGPATQTVEIVKDLIKGGLNVARFNFSHGNHDTHRAMAERVKQAAKELDAPVALMLDTKGPEIRTKTFKEAAFVDGAVEIVKGQKFTLTTRDIEGDKDIVAVTYQDLPKDMKKGGRILLDDGLIELRVDEIKGEDVICTVQNTGPLKNNKGVNLPDVAVNLPALTEKDISDIKFAIEEGFHWIAASFIRSASDIRQIRKVLEENNGTHLKIMAKIENHEGVDNADEIIEAADSIMVARGDLGVEINTEDVPIVQKSLISKANLAGKPVVTATQMLESMIFKPRPTRAEASDVANAIFDGTDAIMLSGETANGEYPVEAVTMMARIAEKAEESIEYNKSLKGFTDGEKISATDAIGYASASITQNIGAATLITLTTSGFTARQVSKFRPFAPVVAVTPCPVVHRQLALSWGTIPVLITEEKDHDELLKKGLEAAKTVVDLKEKDSVVFVSGMPLGVSGTTNNIRVHVIGQEI